MRKDSTINQRGAAHAFLALLLVVGLVGVLGFVGYSAWQRQQADAGDEDTLGRAATTSTNVFYTLVSNVNYDQEGIHSLGLGGKDVRLPSSAPSDYATDVSSDGKWVLVTNGNTITAKSTSDATTKEYPVAPADPNCSLGGKTAMNREARFVGASIKDQPPTIVYSEVVFPCKNGNQQSSTSSAVYTLNQDGSNKSRFLNSSAESVSFGMSDSQKDVALITHSKPAKGNQSGQPFDIISYDKSANTVASVGEGGYNARLSGDGKKVYYNSVVDNSHVISGLKGGSKQKLAINENVVNNFSLNQSGTKVSYVRTASDDVMFVYDVATKKTERMALVHDLKKSTPTKGGAELLKWVDDDRIVFENIDYVNKKYSIKLVNTNNKEVRNLTTLDFGKTSFISFL